MSTPVLIKNWLVVHSNRGGLPSLIGRTTGHPSEYVTEGKFAITSPVVRVERPYIITESGTRYLLDPSEDDREETWDYLEELIWEVEERQEGAKA